MKRLKYTHCTGYRNNPAVGDLATCISTKAPNGHALCGDGTVREILYTKSTAYKRKGLTCGEAHGYVAGCPEDTPYMVDRSCGCESSMTSYPRSKCDACCKSERDYSLVIRPFDILKDMHKNEHGGTYHMRHYTSYTARVCKVPVGARPPACPRSTLPVDQPRLVPSLPVSTC